MTLSNQTLKNINNAAVQVPDQHLLELPEKVLQFGTGVLLRGLTDYYIDKANKAGSFNGRVVVVKSTQSGDENVFASQDNLYTICIRGVAEERTVEENVISASISRVLTASHHWKEILACAADPLIRIIVSNTTEVGIRLTSEPIFDGVPASYPGKLLAFLHKRFEVFEGHPDAGMVIVPTELIVDNGIKLKEIVADLAIFNGLDETFIRWLSGANHFCNSLVDRIVPGKPSKEAQEKLEQLLGYHDDLLITCEAYALWAIEGNDFVRSVLSFAEVSDDVIIAPDIQKHRDLKLRLLNGTHTMSCGLAFLKGFTLVRNAMEDSGFSTYIRQLMLKEIAPAIPDISDDEKEQFGIKVLDRFRNPSIDHAWLAITMQYSSKMKMRVVPVLLNYYREFNEVPQNMALGFAAFVLFMKPVKKEDDRYYGSFHQGFYPINDDLAGYFHETWTNNNIKGIAGVVLKETSLWGTDLTALNGFETAVTNYLQTLNAELLAAEPLIPGLP